MRFCVTEMRRCFPTVLLQLSLLLPLLLLLLLLLMLAHDTVRLCQALMTISPLRTHTLPSSLDWIPFRSCQREGVPLQPSHGSGAA
jgi:hypothetical protein